MDINQSEQQYYLSNMFTPAQYQYRNNLHTIVPNNINSIDSTKLAQNISYNCYSNIANENNDLKYIFGGIKPKKAHQKRVKRPPNDITSTPNQLSILVQEVLPAQLNTSSVIDTVGTVINEVLAKATSRHAHDDVFLTHPSNIISNPQKRPYIDSILTTDNKRPRLIGPPDFRQLVHEPPISCSSASLLPPLALSFSAIVSGDLCQLADNCLKYRRAPFALSRSRAPCQDRFITQNVNTNLPLGPLLSAHRDLNESIDTYIPPSPCSPRTLSLSPHLPLSLAHQYRPHSPTLPLEHAHQYRPHKHIQSPLVDSETGEIVKLTTMPDEQVAALSNYDGNDNELPTYSEKVFKCPKESQENVDTVVVIKSKHSSKIVRIKATPKLTANQYRSIKYHTFRSTSIKPAQYDPRISDSQFNTLSFDTRAVRRRANVVDSRSCMCCGKRGDCAENSSLGRLLFIDVDKWVHARCSVDRNRRDESSLILSAVNNDHSLRVGTLTVLQIGQLHSAQILAGNFHNMQHVYPVGFKSRRIHWSSRLANTRSVFTSEILVAADGERPLFKVTASDDGLPDEVYWASTCTGVWRVPLAKIARLQKQIRPDEGGVSGEELYGLTNPCILRAVESLPGLQVLRDYAFKYGKMQLIAEMPPPRSTTGSARTEQYQRVTGRQAVHQSPSFARFSLPITAETTSTPHNRWQQYRRLKSEWRSNVVLKRSRIEGLGLYAAKDIEKGTMIIEYIGELIRNEVANKREREYQQKNQGIYMFRLNESTVIDATRAGQLARYVNHCCDPNCFTEVIDNERESHIVIVSNRRIEKNEELNYDYKFDLDDAGEEKIACLCGARNCHRWMN